MKHLRLVLFSVLALVVILGITGWSCTKKALEKVTEKALESATNEDVDIDYDEGGVSVKSDEGEWAVGTGAEVPADFPNDMPVYSDAEVMTSAKSSDPQSWSVSLQSDDSVDKVYSYYQTQLDNKGWTTDYSSDYGDIKSLTVSKTGYTGSVMVMKSEDKTTISLTVTVEE